MIRTAISTSLEVATVSLLNISSNCLVVIWFHTFLDHWPPPFWGASGKLFYML